MASLVWRAARVSSTVTSVSTPLLEAREIAKKFGAVQALKPISFHVNGGEVLALLGDNGAGKSTLIKILTGLYVPDQGKLLWEGSEVVFRSPRDAYDRGIATVYQDLAIVDSMSVYRNLFLGREDAITPGIRSLWRINHKLAREQTQQLLAEIGINVRSPDESVARLSGGERQSIAIARGIAFSAKLLILDEPTSALSLRQSAQVLFAIEKAREKGLGVIVISHNVHHVYPVADRFLILSLGEAVADFGRGDHTTEEVSDMIVHGTKLADELRRRERAEGGSTKYTQS